MKYYLHAINSLKNYFILPSTAVCGGPRQGSLVAADIKGAPRSEEERKTSIEREMVEQHRGGFNEC